MAQVHGFGELDDINFSIFMLYIDDAIISCLIESVSKIRFAFPARNIYLEDISMVVAINHVISWVLTKVYSKLMPIIILGIFFKGLTKTVSLSVQLDEVFIDVINQEILISRSSIPRTHMWVMLSN